MNILKGYKSDSLPAHPVPSSEDQLVRFDSRCIPFFEWEEMVVEGRLQNLLTIPHSCQSILFAHKWQALEYSDFIWHGNWKHKSFVFLPQLAVTGNEPKTAQQYQLNP